MNNGGQRGLHGHEVTHSQPQSSPSWWRWKEEPTMQHTGQCDCGCGQHSLWSTVKTVAGRKFWFVCIAHLKAWEAKANL